MTRRLIDLVTEKRNGQPRPLPAAPWPEDQRGDADERNYEETSLAPTPAKKGKKTDATTSEPAPVVVTLADVQTRSVAWLWQGRIPRGAVTILDGDPGLGKSTLTLDLAARVSRGWAMPPAAGLSGIAPSGVILLSAEDDLSATIRPRLEATEADLQRIHSLEAIRTGDLERPPVLPLDAQRLAEKIRVLAVALVIVDPFMAFLDSTIDAHRDQDVRRALHTLKDVAQETGAAILLVRHLAKMAQATALYRGGGSIGIIGAARSGLLVGRHPEKADCRVLASTKSNLGPFPRSLAFTLASAGNDVARIAWGDEVDLSADDIAARPMESHRPSKGDQAAAAIAELLASGPMESGAFEERMAGMSFKKGAIEQGRKKAAVVSYKEGFSGRWSVRLPTAKEPKASEEPEN